MEDMNKIVFAPKNDESNKSSIKDKVLKISKYPGEYVVSTVQGKVSDVIAGAIGGAIVTSPAVAALKKNPKVIKAINTVLKLKKRYFK